jgi:hypothetical protein
MVAYNGFLYAIGGEDSVAVQQETAQEMAEYVTPSTLPSSA